VIACACGAIESFAASVWNSGSPCIFWLPGEANPFPQSDPATLRSLLSDLPPDLQSLASFEIDLIDFLENPARHAVPPALSFDAEPADYGIDPLMHYRAHSPSSTPPQSRIPSHSEALDLFGRLVRDFADARSLTRPDVPIVELLRSLSAWNDSREIVNFARLVAIALVCGRSSDPVLRFGSVAPADFITRELSAVFVPKKFFTAPEFAGFVAVFAPVFCQIVERLCAPRAIAHRYLVGYGMATQPPPPWRAHQGRLCEKLLLQDQLGRDTDHHTALDDHFALARWGCLAVT
jgi:hypothetical protein